MTNAPVPVGATEPTASAEAARKLAKLSLWMLVVFAVWTLIYIFAAGVVTDLFGWAGEDGYVDAWLPWITVTLVWVAPLIVGVVLAARALTMHAGRLAWIGLLANTLGLLFVTVPSLVDRLTAL